MPLVIIILLLIVVDRIIKPLSFWPAPSLFPGQKERPPAGGRRLVDLSSRSRLVASPFFPPTEENRMVPEKSAVMEREIREKRDKERKGEGERERRVDAHRSAFIYQVKREVHHIMSSTRFSKRMYALASSLIHAVTRTRTHVLIRSTSRASIKLTRGRSHQSIDRLIRCFIRRKLYRR